jgi:predicted dehydrogenase
MKGSGATLRIGLVGAGWMGHTHARAWLAHATRAQLVAVADASESRARTLAERYGAGRAQVYPGLGELLAAPDVDAVDICLPHHLHAEAVVAAAGAGKHVLCEKPLCVSLEESRAVRIALERSGTAFMAAHNKLFTSGMREARRLLSEGAVGAVHVVRTIEAGYHEALKRDTPPLELAPGESTWSWRRDPARAGGGELIDNGWHAVYSLLALAGSRPVEVSAVLGDYFIHNEGVEDTGALLVRFESGAMGLVLTSWAFGDPPPSYEFLVSGQRGSFAGSVDRLVLGRHGSPPSEWAFGRPDLAGQAAGLLRAAARRARRPAGRKPTPEHPLAASFVGELGHFLDVVLEGAPGIATWAAAARVLQVILGAYRAAAEHRAVPLPEDPTAL